jgi:hypothetical protein
MLNLTIKTELYIFAKRSHYREGTGKVSAGMATVLLFKLIVQKYKCEDKRLLDLSLVISCF